MVDSGSLTRWAAHLGSPDSQARNEAARAIWERYSARLAAQVRRHLDHRVRRREDEDDVLQSAYKSFCLADWGGREPLRSRDELWRLLAHIAMCKAANAANRHLSLRRDVRRDEGLPQGDDQGFPPWMLEAMDRSEPTPGEVAACAEELRELLRPLPEQVRQVVVLRVEGYSNEEIARAVGRSVRSIEMKFAIARRELRGRLGAASRPPRA